MIDDLPSGTMPLVMDPQSSLKRGVDCCVICYACWKVTVLNFYCLFFAALTLVTSCFHVTPTPSAGFYRSPFSVISKDTGIDAKRCCLDSENPILKLWAKEHSSGFGSSLFSFSTGTSPLQRLMILTQHYPHYCRMSETYPINPSLTTYWD